MFKNRKLLAFCLTAVGAISGASYWWQVARFQETTDNAYVQSDIVNISAKQAGFAEAGWIHDNQPVHKGEVLARIESTDYQLKVDQSMAEVSSAQATVEQLEAQHKLQESLIRVASAQLDSAAAERELSAAELKRVNSLFAKGVVSKDELENAQAVDKKTLAQLEAQKANLESTHLNLAVLDSQISKAEATLQQAQSQLAIARQYLAETVITAPRDGIIGRRQVKDGQLLKSGSVLFSLVDSRTVWVTANFKETQIGQMKIGQPVELEFDAYSGQPVTGYIDSIWPASGARFSLLPPENATGNFTKIVQRIPVKIAIPANTTLAGKLRAGMSVVVNVDTRSQPFDLSTMTLTDNNISADLGQKHLAEI